MQAALDLRAACTRTPGLAVFNHINKKFQKKIIVIYGMTKLSFDVHLYIPYLKTLYYPSINSLHIALFLSFFRAL